MLDPGLADPSFWEGGSENQRSWLINAVNFAGLPFWGGYMLDPLSNNLSKFLLAGNMLKMII
jgi:hypothetical protein